MLQDMWYSCPKVFAIVVSVLPAVGPLPKALIDMAERVSKKVLERRCYNVASRAYPKLGTGEKMLQRSIQSVSEVSCEKM